MVKPVRERKIMEVPIEKLDISESYLLRSLGQNWPNFRDHRGVHQSIGAAENTYVENGDKKRPGALR